MGKVSKQASRLKAARIKWATVKHKKGDTVQWIPLEPNTEDITPTTRLQNGFKFTSSSGPLVVNLPEFAVSGSCVNEAVMKIDDGSHYVIRCRSVPLRPSSLQVKLLPSMLDDVSSTFNLARQHPQYVAVVKAYHDFDHVTGDFKKLPNAPSHRVVAKDVVTSTAIKNGPHKALLKTPFDLRDNAVKDAIATLKSDITKFKKAGGKFSFTHNQTYSKDKHGQ